MLTIIVGLFGINVDGIPGAQNTPYAFGLFTALMVLLGAVLIAVGLIYLGLKNPSQKNKWKLESWSYKMWSRYFNTKQRLMPNSGETTSLLQLEICLMRIIFSSSKQTQMQFLY